MKKTYNTGYTVLAIMEGLADSFIQAELMVMQAQAAAHSQAAATSPNDDDDEEEELSPLLQLVQDPSNADATLAVVTIKGQLTDRDSPYNRYYGLVSYNQIREAIVDGLDNGASAVLFDTNTPGGSLSGMRDLSSFIESLSTPTIFHTSSTLASAGLFLALSGDHVLASDMAEVGSIGVVCTLVEYSKAMADAGYTATVIRSGDLKQVGNPTEPLSAEGKAHITQQVMTYAQKFFSFVEEKRGMQLTDEHRSGRTFIGEEAAAPSINLVDRISTFEEALSFSLYLANNYLDKQRQISNANNNNNFFNQRLGAQIMNKKLSTGALSTMVASLDLAAVPSVDDPNNTSVTEPTAEVVILQDRITELEASLATATTELAEKATALEALETVRIETAAASDLLKEIVAAQISTMRVALNFAPADFAAMDAGGVAKEYGAVAASFAKSFPVGGVVPESMDTAKPAQSAKLTAEESRAIKALSF
jgi:signal peptide peptidase SppA